MPGDSKARHAGNSKARHAGPLARFSVTMPESLLAEFDRQTGAAGKENRSEALRGLVRRYIAEGRWRSGEGEVYGTATLVYDHHLPNLTRELTELQHDHGDVILCSTHVHVSHETCLECVIMKGRSLEIQKFIKALGRLRGIKSLDTVVTAV